MPERDQQTLQFVRLLGQHEQRLKWYILSLVPHWADADEIHQETNIRLWEQFESYDSSLDFGAWACTIAYYQIQTHRQKANRRVVDFGERFDKLVLKEITSRSNEIGPRHHALSLCLDKLSEKRRSLVQQYYIGNAPVKDLASQLGLSASAVYKSLASIRCTLHDCVERTLRRESS